MDMHPTLCSLAKRVAFEHFGMRLDLSARSVRHVEKILGAIHEEHLKTRSVEGFDGIALEFAAYIVDVVQRNFGPAQWERDCSQFGADVYPLHWRGAVLYPYTWCQNRIYDGAANNVWATFRASVLLQAQPWWKRLLRR